jgi:hypothetical protein
MWFFIRHNCFGINSIHAFQPIKCFIQIIRQLVIIIQKVPWFSTFIHLVTFIQLHVGKKNPRHSYVA